MPLFAATQSVTDGGSAGESMATGMVRATQQSLAFTPTQGIAAAALSLCDSHTIYRARRVYLDDTYCSVYGHVVIN